MSWQPRWPISSFAERREVLELLELRERLIAEQPVDPRCQMADYLTEFGGPPPQSTVRHVVHQGERPPIAEFIASFAPVMPPTPVERKSRATELPPPDVPVRVPSGRRGKLLDDVLTRTQEEMAAGRQSDDVDKLQPYRGVGQLHLDGSEFPDE